MNIRYDEPLHWFKEKISKIIISYISIEMSFICTHLNSLLPWKNLDEIDSVVLEKTFKRRQWILRRLQGQLSVLPNLTNSPKKLHIIKDFNLNIKTIFESTSLQNLLQLRALHNKSKMKIEKNKLKNNYNVKRNRKHTDIIKLE